VSQGAVSVSRLKSHLNKCHKELYALYVAKVDVCNDESPATSWTTTPQHTQLSITAVNQRYLPDLYSVYWFRFHFWPKTMYQFRFRFGFGRKINFYFRGSVIYGWKRKTRFQSVSTAVSMTTQQLSAIVTHDDNIIIITSRLNHLSQDDNDNNWLVAS